MDELLRFLGQNWWLVIILLAWMASAIGDVFTKAAKKAAAEERARRRQAGSGEPLVETPQHPRRPTAEEVAAEIRRMMGMEADEEQRSPGGSRPVILEEEWEQEAEWQEVTAEPAPSALPEPEPEPERQTQAMGGLRERLAQKRADEISKVAGRHIHAATETGGVHDRHLQTSLMRKLQVREGSRYLRRRAARGHQMTPGQLVSFTDPVKAWVMLEVFGPPKALRDESF